MHNVIAIPQRIIEGQRLFVVDIKGTRQFVSHNPFAQGIHVDCMRAGDDDN